MKKCKSIKSRPEFGFDPVQVCGHFGVDSGLFHSAGGGSVGDYAHQVPRLVDGLPEGQGAAGVA